MENSQTQMLRSPELETHLQKGSIHSPDHLDYAFILRFSVELQCDCPVPHLHIEIFSSHNSDTFRN